jgi:hypothetical protein
VDQIQSILPHLPYDGAIICVFFKWFFEYKSLYMLENVHPNMVMVILWNLIKTLLYKYSNVTIRHQWVSLFALHLESQIPTYNNASSNNFDFDNEEIHCTPKF